MTMSGYRYNYSQEEKKIYKRDLGLDNADETIYLGQLK